MKNLLDNDIDGKQTKESQRFGQFVFWTTLVAFGFGMVEVLAFVLFGDHQIGAAGAVTLGYGSCLLVAGELLRRGQMKAAVTISCTGLLVGIVLVALILPIAIPALTILPLVVVALALSYVQEQDIRILILAAWGTGIFVAVLSEVLAPQLEIPTWFSIIFRISSIVTALGLAFLLMWQFTSRLKDTLAQTRAVNAELQNEVTERKLAQETLRASEERYRRFFENMHETFLIQEIIADETGQPIDLRYLDLNPAAERILGKTRDEIVGRTRSQLSGRPDPEGVEMARRVAVTGTPFHMVRYSPGFGGWFESFTYSLGSGIVATLSLDITERKHAEEALRQSQENFAKAFNSNPAAIAITRLADGKFLNLNPAYTRIMEYEPREILDHTAVEMNIYVHPKERDQVIQQLREQGAVQNYELLVRVKSGETRSIVISMEPILYNEEECILSVFLDISERKKMEAELRRSNDELEQFAYVASHDLQEPLRAVAGMVQLLDQRYKGKLDERADEYIGHAVEASGRMQSLINDLLDYSRVDRLGKPFSSANLERSLDIALANLRISIQKSGAQITRDPLPTVMADASQLTQVFQNLIGNAIKFRGESPLQIHIGAQEVDNAWRFEVRDNGIGIEPQYFERIFLVFQRLHTRREYSGTGIGLSLCKKIVERHGGQIWVESQAGRGSTFYFTISNRR